MKEWRPPQPEELQRRKPLPATPVRMRRNDASEAERVAHCSIGLYVTFTYTQ